MIVLDTDHVTVLHRREHSQYATLSTKIARSADQDFSISAVTVEEQMRGWLAAIRRARKVHDQIVYYTGLVGLIDFYFEWQLVPFDDSAAEQFESLRKQRIRIGTQDLKIASTALVSNALLLSANLRDFEQVPGLHVENWLL